MSSAWPFLISRNRNHDYRAVVVPEQFVGTDLPARLLRFVDADAGTQPTVCDVERDVEKPFSLLYRVVDACEASEKLRDSAGRSIRWIEGVVVLGQRARLKQPAEVLDRAHLAVAQPFRAFWEGALAQQVSSPLEVALEKPTLSSDTRQRRALRIKSRARIVGAAIALIIVWWSVRSVLSKDCTDIVRAVRLSHDAESKVLLVTWRADPMLAGRFTQLHKQVPGLEFLVVSGRGLKGAATRTIDPALVDAYLPSSDKVGLIVVEPAGGSCRDAIIAPDQLSPKVLRKLAAGSR